MKLGAFSMSLSVKDIHKSKVFYEHLGFEEAGGNIEQNWLIMRSGSTVIGLFQGMFDDNILTFNPGWNQNEENVDPFTDIREIQKQLRDKGIAFTSEADETTSGSASFTIEDPDGNTILVDQHR